jgi:uncharacterized Tic20 family protein
MTTEPATWGGETTDQERTYAMAAHILAVFFPVFGAGRIYAMKQDESAYIKYHSLQAAIFQLIAWAIGSATCGVGLLLLVLPILWAMKANKGEWTGYPLLDGIGRP